MVRISKTSPSAGIHKQSAGKAKSSPSKGGKSDSVQVSDASSLRERAKEILADMPDVRLEQIEGIRGALEDGSYKMNSKTISAHIVRNALSEHSWG